MKKGLRHIRRELRWQKGLGTIIKTSPLIFLIIKTSPLIVRSTASIIIFLANGPKGLVRRPVVTVLASILDSFLRIMILKWDWDWDWD